MNKICFKSDIMKFLKFFLLFLIILQFRSINAQNMISIHDKNRKKPIVFCIHGFYRTKLNMYFIAKSLKKDNEVYNWRYKSRDKYINEHAQDLVNQLIEIAKNNPNKPINFVTHSMGGLVLRCALNHKACPIEAKIGKAVLIAAPNKGSVMAQKLQKSRLVRYLFKDKAGSELMKKKDFDDLGVFPASMEILQIVGTFGLNPWLHEKNDGKIAVSETKLNSPYKQINVKASHSWICYSPKVIRYVKEFIRAPSE